jgi:hypothetical protein
MTKSKIASALTAIGGKPALVGFKHVSGGSMHWD